MSHSELRNKLASDGLSAYLIGGEVWVCRTSETAQKEPPHTLAMGSIRLTLEEARMFGAQVLAAALKGDKVL